jgi:hypothetical protein
MSDWYDNYRKRIDAEAANVKPADEISQGVLRMKDVGTKAFDDDTHCTMFNGVDKNTGTMRFGFTESLVNQLMQYAYDQGARDIEKKSYETGYNTARSEFLKSIDAMEPFDN